MKLRYAMVCSSNQNRSMEAHSLLKKHGFDVSSYGTGTHVKLPGPSIREPNIYEFGTPYKQMLDELHRKDPNLRLLCVGVGMTVWPRPSVFHVILLLCVKLAPQRWQDNAADGYFDVVLAFEEKVFDVVIEAAVINVTDLHNREHALLKPVLMINLEVKDNHEEAASGARLTLDLCQELEATESWADNIDEIVSAFERRHHRKLLTSVTPFRFVYRRRGSTSTNIMAT
ncbi:hypothetical protein Dimus_026932 [Dionaea muscipula]